ncbi:MAG: hypothetical protein K9H64_03715 [Bacteroidales bacterium]|nr:hypothetical protein [Bacteroidales bacterium]MCF8454941.1 hypothetical protein [Bacteroidales bacterium]
MKKLILFLIVTSSSFMLSAQSVSVDHYNVNQGTQVLVPINLTNLTDVGAITLFLTFDNTVLEYDTVLNINSNFSGLLFNNMGNQQIGMAWSAFLSGVTITSEQLCEVRFNFLGGACDLTFPASCDIANFTSTNTMSISYVDGSVSETIVASISGLGTAYCQDAPTINLLGSPEGGIFTINGNIATSFQPGVLPPGTYSVDYTVVNAYGFGDTASQTVILHEAPTLSIQTQDVLCFGQSTGEVTTLITGGTSPYSYTWSDGQTSATATNLVAGSYSLILTDSNGCEDNANFGISQGTEILIDVTVTHVSQFGAGDGAVDLTVSGGNPPYSYLWTGGFTTEDLSNLDGDLYGLTLIDASACEVESEALVRIHSSQQLSFPAQWSMFSFNIEPYEPSADSVLQPILSNIQIAKDETGNVFWPTFNLNLIGDFQIEEGYQIRCNVPSTLTCYGFYLFPEEIPIPLASGWSLFGYLRTSNLATGIAMSTINSNIVLMKDGAGHVYWPIFNLNLIGNMIPGQGYQIKMNVADTLVYPPN